MAASALETATRMTASPIVALVNMVLLLVARSNDRTPALCGTQRLGACEGSHVRSGFLNWGTGTSGRWTAMTELPVGRMLTLFVRLAASR
jgi:hypothetical protein